MSKVLKGLVVIITLGLLVQCMSGMETSYASEPTRPYAQSTSTYQTTNKSTSTTNKSTTTNTTNKSTSSTNKSTTTKATTSTNTTVTTEKVDPRVPNYNATNPDYQVVQYSWKTRDGGNAYFSLCIDVNAYKYYSSLDRYYLFSEYDHYLNDKLNREYVKEIARCLREIQKQAGYTDYDIVCEAVNFVQTAIEYEYDSAAKGQSDYPKYAIETLWDREGDCEDSAMLLAALIRELGYGSLLMHYEGHVAASVLGNDNMTGTFLNVNGGKYFYIESTGTGWDIGGCPDTMTSDKYKGYLMVD